MKIIFAVILSKISLLVQWRTVWGNNNFAFYTVERVSCLRDIENDWYTDKYEQRSQLKCMCFYKTNESQNDPTDKTTQK